MGLLAEVREILEALVRERGLDDPTFQRMVRWYGYVADELDCRVGYERILADVRAGVTGRAA